MRIRDKEQIPTTTKPPKPDISDNESIAGLNVKQRKSVKMELLAAAALKAAEEAVEAANALAVARASLQMKKQTYYNEGYIERYIRSRGQPMPEDCSVISAASYEERDAEDDTSHRNYNTSVFQEAQLRKDDIIDESPEEREGTPSTDDKRQCLTEEQQESTMIEAFDEEIKDEPLDERESVAPPADSNLQNVEGVMEMSEELKEEIMDTNESVDERQGVASPTDINLLSAEEKKKEEISEVNEIIIDTNESLDREAALSPTDIDLQILEEEATEVLEVDTNKAVDEREVVPSQTDSNLQNVKEEVREVSEMDANEPVDGREMVLSPTDINLQIVEEEALEVLEVDTNEAVDERKIVSSPTDSNLQAKEELREISEVDTNEPVDERKMVSLPVDINLQIVEEKVIEVLEVDINELVDEREMLVSPTDGNVQIATEEVIGVSEANTNKPVHEREVVASPTDSNLQIAKEEASEVSEVGANETVDKREAVESPNYSKLQESEGKEESVALEVLLTGEVQNPLDATEPVQIFNSRSEDVVPFDEISSKDEQTVESELHGIDEVQEAVANNAPNANGENDSILHACTKGDEVITSDTVKTQSLNAEGDDAEGDDAEGDDAEEVFEEEGDILSTTQETESEAATLKKQDVVEEGTSTKELSKSQETTDARVQTTATQVHDGEDEFHEEVETNFSNIVEEDVLALATSAEYIKKESAYLQDAEHLVSPAAEEQKCIEDQYVALIEAEILYTNTNVEHENVEVVDKQELKNTNTSDEISKKEVLIEKPDMITGCNDVGNEDKIEADTQAEDKIIEMENIVTQKEDASKIIGKVSATAELSPPFEKEEEEQRSDEDEVIAIIMKEISISLQAEQTPEKLEDPNLGSNGILLAEMVKAPMHVQQEELKLEQADDVSTVSKKITKKELSELFLAEQLPGLLKDSEEEIIELISPERVSEETMKQREDTHQQLEDVIIHVDNTPDGEEIADSSLSHQEEDEVVECTSQNVKEVTIHEGERSDDEPTESTSKGKDKILIENDPEDMFINETNVSIINNTGTSQVDEIKVEEKSEVGEHITEKASCSKPVEEGQDEFTEVIAKDENDIMTEDESTNEENAESSTELLDIAAVAKKAEEIIAACEEDAIIANEIKIDEGVESMQVGTDDVGKQEVKETHDSVIFDSAIPEENIEEQAVSGENEVIEATPQEESGNDHVLDNLKNEIDHKNQKELSINNEELASHECNATQVEETFSDVDVNKIIEEMKDRCNNIQNEIKNEEEDIGEPTKSLTEINIVDGACNVTGHAENEEEEPNQCSVEEKTKDTIILDTLPNERGNEVRTSNKSHDAANVEEELNQCVIDKQIEDIITVNILSTEANNEGSEVDHIKNEEEESNQSVNEEETEQIISINTLPNEVNNEDQAWGEADDTENEKEEFNHSMVQEKLKETIIANTASKEGDKYTSTDDDSQEARDTFDVTTTPSALFEEPILTANNFKPCDEEVQDFIKQLTHNFSDVHPISHRQHTLSAECESVEGDEEVQEFIKEITNNFTDIQPFSPMQQTLSADRETNKSDEEVQDFIKNLVDAISHDECDDDHSMENDLKEEANRKILLQSSIENDFIDEINNIDNEKLQDKDSSLKKLSPKTSPLLERFKMEHDMLNYKADQNHTDSNDYENISDMKESVVNEDAVEQGQYSDSDISKEEDSTNVFEGMQKHKYKIQHDVALAKNDHNACGTGCLVS